MRHVGPFFRLMLGIGYGSLSTGVENGRKGAAVAVNAAGGYFLGHSRVALAAHFTLYGLPSPQLTDSTQGPFPENVDIILLQFAPGVTYYADSNFYASLAAGFAFASETNSSSGTLASASTMPS